MKKENDSLIQDVEELLQKSTIAEATQKVWESFSQAMDQMDEDSQELLEQFFAGKSIKQLSQENHISEKEMEAWLQKARRELIENLKAGFQVRQ